MKVSAVQPVGVFQHLRRNTIATAQEDDEFGCVLPHRLQTMPYQIIRIDAMQAHLIQELSV
jgi:hypothetical protein